MTQGLHFNIGDIVKYYGKDFRIKRGPYIVFLVEDTIIYIKNIKTKEKWKVAFQELKLE